MSNSNHNQDSNKRISSDRSSHSPFSRSKKMIYSSQRYEKDIETINRDILEKKYYEAYQQVHRLFSRLLMAKNFELACRHCITYAKKFSDVKEYNLSVLLGINFVQLAKTRNIQLKDDHFSDIIDIFLSIPISKGPRKYDFMNKALNWAEKAGDLEKMKFLHQLIGNSYVSEKSYGVAQNHLVYCGDPRSLANLVKEWQNFGYLSEKYLFPLRIILILLYLRDLETAENFLNLLDVCLDSDEVHPFLQFAYLIVVACKLKNKDFYYLVKKKYSLVIRRDHAFTTYLEEIERVYFAVEAPKKLSIFNILSNFPVNTK